MEVFKCFDGHLTPDSIGIKDKKCLKKVHFMTKVIVKVARLLCFVMALTMFVSVSFLFFKKVKNGNLKVNDIYEWAAFIFWFPATSIAVYFLAATLIVPSFCFQIITYHCLVNTRYYNKLITNFKIKQQFGCKRLLMRYKIMNMIKTQNEFSIRIMKYNRFWRKFYLLMMVHYLPANLILFQQILFGDMSFELRILFVLCYLLGVLFIVSSSLFVCYLVREMKIYRKKLIKLQFDKFLKLGVSTKIKVSLLLCQSNLNQLN